MGTRAQRGKGCKTCMSCAHVLCLLCSCPNKPPGELSLPDICLYNDGTWRQGFIVNSCIFYHCNVWRIQRKLSKKTRRQVLSMPVADLEGAFVGQIFIFMQFSGKNWSNSRLTSPLRGWHPHPGNPGCATECAFVFYELNTSFTLSAHLKLRCYLLQNGFPFRFITLLVDTFKNQNLKRNAIYAPAGRDFRLVYTYVKVTVFVPFKNGSYVCLHIAHTMYGFFFMV